MADKSHTTNPTTANHDPVVDLYDRLVAMRSARPEDPDDDALDRHIDRQNELIARSAVMPAKTLAGVLAKVRIFAIDMEPGVSMHGDNIIESLVEDLERMTAPDPANERATNPSETERKGVIRKGVFDLDALIGQCDVCSTTIGKLAEYVETDHVQQSLYSVNTDLGSALIKMRRLYNDLHVAAGGQA